ncbi:MAG: hypothetical protein M5U01_10645 [Ardenticatenaceae bacterium]|nr:hypothetical protein [Ardenticatenaceae bacterium]
MWSRRWQASAGMARGAFMVGREDHVADEPAGHRWERLPVPPDVVASRGRGAGL